MIRMTMKQLEILKVIKDRRPSDGETCSVYDVMNSLSYDVERTALLHSIATLVKEGYIERLGREKRDGRSLNVFTVTAKGYSTV